ncbi:GNAT family N-acetyltransferase [Rhodanobacter ginsengiterrae]|uniref:GNAT family N-acetyltransferase n=1 Tax=Rhodanobacter ginsengiterrae TaxID=2008451 RepID=UPI003CF3CD1D
MNPGELDHLNAELTDGRLRLRPWQHADAAPLVEAVGESLDSVGRWLPWCRAGYDLAQANDWVAFCQAGWIRGEHFAFPIFDIASGQLMGGAGLTQHDPRHRSANLGYWVRGSCQRRGVATAAAQLVARFGFEQLGLIRIEIVIQPDNKPSRALADRTGARFETIARQRLCVEGEPRDAAVYGWIPQDLG